MLGTNMGSARPSRGHLLIDRENPETLPELEIILSPEAVQE